MSAVFSLCTCYKSVDCNKLACFMPVISLFYVKELSWILSRQVMVLDVMHIS